MQENKNEKVIRSLRQVEASDEDVIWTAEQLHGISGEEARQILSDIDRNEKSDCDALQMSEGVGAAKSAIRESQNRIGLYDAMLYALKNHPNDQRTYLLAQGFSKEDIGEADLHVVRNARSIKVKKLLLIPVEWVVWIGVFVFIMAMLDEEGVWFWGLAIVAVFGIGKSVVMLFILPFQSFRVESLESLIEKFHEGENQ